MWQVGDCGKRELRVMLRVCVVLVMVTHCTASPHSRSALSSKLRYSTDPQCVNGGRSVSTLSKGEHMFCLCPDGFSGPRCEIDESVSCFVRRGLSYRGPEAQSESGRECLEWDPENSRRVFGADSWILGLGQHNRCRNPDRSRRPWCFVLGPYGRVKEYCNIPRCHREPGPALSPPSLSNPGWNCGERFGWSQKIVGGSLTAVELHPWMAAVFWKTSGRNSDLRRTFQCAGSLIAPCWVLTAAHCFPNGAGTDLARLSVTLGKSALNETDEKREQEFRVTQLHLHEDFDDTEGSFDSDIALLRISTLDGVCAQQSNSVRTVCVAPPHISFPDGTSCQIAGYGKEHQGLWYNSQYLREARVNLIPQEVCSSTSYYGDMITDNMLCAGDPEWKVDACKGDSGGPLVCSVNRQAFVLGVVSWGDGCSQKFRPGVYTRVTNYNQWILEKTGLVPITAKSLQE